MKKFLDFFIILSLFQNIASLNVVEIRPSDLQHLFTRSNGINSLKIDQSNSDNFADNTNQKVFKFNVFFEEQCAIKCLRNIYCVQYSYTSDKVCSLNLKANFERRIQFEDQNEQESISNKINCNLNDCSKGVYCSASSITPSEGTCLCHGMVSGKGCSSGVLYQLTPWSEWSECSANCDHNNGFKKRSKNCVQNFLNRTSTVQNMDWLCNKEMLINQFQSVSCSVEKCRTYAEWSEWSDCSKICGGYTQRTRECFKNVDCDKKFLKQVKECSFKNCNSIEIVLDQTKLSSTNTDILKRGILKFQDLYSYDYIRIFSHTESKNEINKIGNVVCKEFGFKDLNNIDAKKIPSLKDQFESDAKYKNYLSNNAINGIVCTGTEKNLKDCKVDYKDSDLFELEIECTYDGYWSQWSQWSQCSATCGAGARTRSRACKNPMPSISESDGPNGLDCPPGKKVELSTCFMAKCEDNIDIF